MGNSIGKTNQSLCRKIALEYFIKENLRLHFL